MFGISWSFDMYKTQKLYGKQRFDTFLDFPSKQAAKEFSESELNNICCAKCGGKRIRAKGIKINLYKVLFYKQIQKDGMLGRKKLVDELEKTMWRIDGSSIEDGITGEGIIKCKTCKNCSYRFPSMEFLCLSLSSANNIAELILDTPRKDRVEFISEKLSLEAMKRPVKIKKLLYLCKDKIKYYSGNSENDIKYRRKYEVLLADLGSAAFHVLDTNELSDFQ